MKKNCANDKANAKLATTSAAARAIDCFIFRQAVDSCIFHEGQPSNETPQYFCINCPYLEKARPELPDSFKGKLISFPAEDQRSIPTVSVRDDLADAEKEGATLTSDKCNTDQEKGDNGTFAGSMNICTSLQQVTNRNDATPLNFNPKHELYEYYSRLLKGSVLAQLKNYFTVWGNLFDKTIRYTCIFTDPISLETFASGHIPEKTAGAIINENGFWYRKCPLCFIFDWLCFTINVFVS